MVIINGVPLNDFNFQAKPDLSDFLIPAQAVKDILISNYFSLTLLPEHYAILKKRKEQILKMRREFLEKTEEVALTQSNNLPSLENFKNDKKFASLLNPSTSYDPKEIFDELEKYEKFINSSSLAEIKTKYTEFSTSLLEYAEQLLEIDNLSKTFNFKNIQDIKNTTKQLRVAFYFSLFISISIFCTIFYVLYSILTLQKINQKSAEEISNNNNNQEQLLSL